MSLSMAESSHRRLVRSSIVERGQLISTKTRMIGSFRSYQVAPEGEEISSNRAISSIRPSDGVSDDLTMVDRIYYHLENKMARSGWQKFYMLLYVVIIFWGLFTVLWKYTSAGDDAFQEEISGSGGKRRGRLLASRPGSGESYEGCEAASRVEGDPEQWREARGCRRSPGNV